MRIITEKKEIIKIVKKENLREITEQLERWEKFRGHHAEWNSGEYEGGRVKEILTGKQTYRGDILYTIKDNGYALVYQDGPCRSLEVWALIKGKLMSTIKMMGDVTRHDVIKYEVE